MELLTSIDDIIKFDEKFKKITEGLIIRTGSLFLLPSNAWSGWGIGITDENREALKQIAQEERENETNKREECPEIEAFIKPQMRERLEPRMARYMAECVKEVAKLIFQTREDIVICDLPARDGLLSNTIALQLDADLNQKMRYHLVDRSEETLNLAKTDLVRRGGNVTEHAMSDTDFLKQCPDNFFDIFVSLSHLHHISFLDDYLPEVRRVLKDDGVLLIGDRHSAMFDHPLHTEALLKMIGAEERTIRSFRKHFGERRMAPDPFVQITEEECTAISDHKDYWKQIVEILRSKYDPSMPKVAFFEANETSAARRMKLEKAGFDLEPDDKGKAFLRSMPKRVVRGSDFAVVMGAVKKAR